MTADSTTAGTLSFPCSDDEAALIASAIAGDGDAYGRLVRRYERVSYRVAAAVAGSAADGEEAVQNAYVKAHRSLPRFRRGAPFRPWLLRIVVNEARNVRRSELRHRRLAVRAAEVVDVAPPGAEDTALESGDVEAVLAGLARLSEQDRVALALRYFAELCDRDAAIVAGITEGAYRVRVLRALRRLRARLEERDD
jgi:RNA polymerase sigma-70 factor (ECF subfamily)